VCESVLEAFLQTGFESVIEVAPLLLLELLLLEVKSLCLLFVAIELFALALELFALLAVVLGPECCGDLQLLLFELQLLLFACELLRVVLMKEGRKMER